MSVKRVGVCLRARFAVLVLFLVVTLLSSCRGIGDSPTPVVIAEPGVAFEAETPTGTEPMISSEIEGETTVTPLPKVPGLTDAQVAGLMTFKQVDEYPLYVMRHYGHADTLLAPPLRDPPAVPAFACSLFAALGDPETRLYGRNFDWDYSPALMLFAYPDDGYASVSMVDLGFYFSEVEARGLADAPLSERRRLLDMVWHPFDGMNDQGLAVGMAAVPDSDVLREPNLPTVGSLGIIREMLDHAATVEEAIEIMKDTNIDMEGGPQIHYLLADATGRAILVEYYKGERVVLATAKGWHLATNHFRTPLDEAETSICDRYARLDEVLRATAGRLTPESAMDLLSDVSQPSTQWSVVYDIAGRQVHVVMGHHYERVHVMPVR